MTHCEESNTKKIVSHGRRLISPDCFRFATRSVENNASNELKQIARHIVCMFSHGSYCSVRVPTAKFGPVFSGRDMCRDHDKKKKRMRSTHIHRYILCLLLLVGCVDSQPLPAQISVCSFGQILREYLIIFCCLVCTCTVHIFAYFAK